MAYIMHIKYELHCVYDMYMYMCIIYLYHTFLMCIHII